VWSLVDPWSLAKRNDQLLEVYGMTEPPTFTDMLIIQLWRDLYRLKGALRHHGRSLVPRCLGAHTVQRVRDSVSGLEPDRMISASVLAFINSYAVRIDLLDLLQHSASIESATVLQTHRRRDVMPLPRCHAQLGAYMYSDAATNVVNFAILALNRMSGSPGFGGQ
jgi:hypothetical protein